MSEQDLKELWQSQSLADPSRDLKVTGEMIEQMKKKMRRLEGQLIWRDVREWAACLVLGGWFAFDLHETRHAPLPLRHMGDCILIGCALFIAARLLLARRSQTPASQTVSVRDYLSEQIRKLGRQIRLLQTVLWWYLLPIFCGISLYFIGSNDDPTDDCVVLSSIAVVFFVIYLVNRRAARVHLPLKQELERAFQSVAESAAPNDANPAEENQS